jgi:hypothetical protein
MYKRDARAHQVLQGNGAADSQLYSKTNSHYHQYMALRKGHMYSLTMARAHPYRWVFLAGVLISVVALAQHHSHCAPAGIRAMVCLHGTIPRTVSLSLYQCGLPTTLAGLITVLRSHSHTLLQLLMYAWHLDVHALLHIQELQSPNW